MPLVAYSNKNEGTTSVRQHRLLSSVPFRRRQCRARDVLISLPRDFSGLARTDPGHSRAKVCVVVRPARAFVQFVVANSGAEFSCARCEKSKVPTARRDTFSICLPFLFRFRCIFLRCESVSAVSCKSLF